MSITGFKELYEVTDLLTAGASFGNETLYGMCRNANLRDPRHLADLIWIIGRAYAASPERRTYGFERDENGKILTNGNKRVHLAKAKSSADGKGDYFFAIAEYITGQEAFEKLFNIIFEIRDLSLTFASPIFTEAEGERVYSDDIKLLAKGVAAVYLFNNLIRRASEDFDEVTPGSPEWEKGARCKNQISFCSKFLHFHCRNIVYIIDQYSLIGGKVAVPSQNLGKLPLFKPGRDMDDRPIKVCKGTISGYDEVRDGLKTEFKKIVTIDRAEQETVEARDTEDEEKFDSYLDHVSRAYCTARYLHGKEKAADPRRIDDLFLRLGSGDKLNARDFIKFCQGNSTEF